MFCTKCGETNPAEAEFCFACGTAIHVVTVPAVVAAAAPDAEPKLAPTPPPGNGPSRKPQGEALSVL
jgi:hypothetical protein